MYYWSITAQLKIAIDRLFAVTEKSPEYHTPMQHCVLLMAAEGDTPDNFEPVEHEQSSNIAMRQQACYQDVACQFQYHAYAEYERPQLML